MSVIAKKEDIRITKTENAVMRALMVLLEKQSFVQITIMDICREALIGRATFYAHYDDKYDLLKKWLDNLKTELSTKDNTLEQLEESINSYVKRKKRTIKNIIADANEDTLTLLTDWIISNLLTKKSSGVQKAVISNFCAGGIIHYITWQVRNRFPCEIPTMNPFIYNIIKNIFD